MYGALCKFGGCRGAGERLCIPISEVRRLAARPENPTQLCLWREPSQSSALFCGTLLRRTVVPELFFGGIRTRLPLSRLTSDLVCTAAANRPQSLL